MTTIQREPVKPTVIDQAPEGKPRNTAWMDKGRLYLALYLLLAPTLIGMLVFNYYPKFEAIYMSLYDWDGQFTKDLVWFRNFTDLFTGRDPLFWPTFQLVGILLVANAVKMWPSIFAAITLHRIKSEKWQYFYRVLFVLPMVIPGLVWLLIWKNFFDPNVGVLNRLLNATGLMHVMNWLDMAMPKVAATSLPSRRRRDKCRSDSPRSWRSFARGTSPTPSEWRAESRRTSSRVLTRSSRGGWRARIS